MANEPLDKKNAAGGIFPHFMLKEIYEQPSAILESIRRNMDDDRIFPSALEPLESALLTLKKIIVAASGSSRHAGLAGEIMIEDLCGVAVDVEYASEYCYRSAHEAAEHIVMVITQSGETADTIAAQREALARSVRTVAITNVSQSTVAREASASLLTHATPEVAVPATKSFTTQLAVLYLFALFLASKRGRMSSEVLRRHLGSLSELPAELEKSIPVWDSEAEEYARQYRQAQTFLYLGRNVHYAIAREGALKLKEVSYAHAEGYPAGELKHGPSALVNEQGLVVVLATCDESDPGSVLRYRRIRAVLENVKACRGKVIAVATEGDREVPSLADHTWFVPAAPELLLPTLEVVPLQLFAYHVGVLNGCDVDRPRNLVKAVVTE